MASKFNFFSLYLFVAFQRVNSNNGTCYYPDGTINIGDHPCDPNADVSMCCSDISQCLTNGLCALGDTTSRSGISFARGTCTDESWESEICPQHCRVNLDSAYNASAKNFGDDGVEVWDCGPGQGYAEPASYCCESQGESILCCSTSSAVFHLDAATHGNPSSTTTSSSSSSSTASTIPIASHSSAPSTGAMSSTAATPVPTATPRTDNEKGGTSSRGTRIGVGVGIPLGLIFLGALAFLFWRLSRNENARKQLEARLVTLAGRGHGEEMPELDGTAKAVIELDSCSRYEMGAERRKSQPLLGATELEARGIGVRR